MFNSGYHYERAMEDQMDTFIFGENEPAGCYNFGPPDPLFYHMQISFNNIRRTSKKAILFIFDKRELWLPKSICKNLDEETKTVFVHKKTFKKILENIKND